MQSSKSRNLHLICLSSLLCNQTPKNSITDAASVTFEGRYQLHTNHVEIAFRAGRSDLEGSNDHLGPSSRQ